LPENPAIGGHLGYWKWIPAFAGMAEWKTSEYLPDTDTDAHRMNQPVDGGP
jgi:hypothetical protein